MVNALNIGNNILDRAFRDGIDVTPMKLQKLIYIVYKKYYQENHMALFREPFEAWRYGPVIREVYNEFKDFGANHIDRYATERDGSVYMADEESSPRLKSALDYVWGKYKNYDGITLSSMTHSNGTAWSKAVETAFPYLKDDDIISEGVLASA